MTSIAFYAPGSRYYDNGLFYNHKDSFANISVTGSICQCRCEHCQGLLLNKMLSATEPEILEKLGADLYQRGCKGVLISGGALCDGSVPLKKFAGAIKKLSEMGLAVVVHPGLLSDETAREFKKSKVRRVALDLIGDSDTIKDVYHLHCSPESYQKSLQAARAAGLKASPHIVIGLHYGEIRGEYQAIKMVAAEGAESLVLVILNPLKNTPMWSIKPPSPDEVAKVFMTARKLLPDIPIALGCARPPGLYAREIERLAVISGLNAIAFPARETVDFVRSLGIDITYRETCCGMIERLAE